MATTAERIRSKRSFTNGHTLLPATHDHVVHVLLPILPTQRLISWTMGRGTMLWKIWPAVLLHTVFAGAVVTISLKTKYDLSVPSVLLTVLGVVIGFVISYRAMSGYDRYWMGRCSWGDVIRNARTLSRLIWFTVPLHLTPKTKEEIESGELEREQHEINRVMAEKILALDLIEGFVVALKHHLRSEPGIYYEDLYYLVKPLHNHSKQKDQVDESTSPETIRASGLPANHSRTNLRRATASAKSQSSIATPTTASGSRTPVEIEHSVDTTNFLDFPDPVVPDITAYGTFNASVSTTSRPRSHSSNHSSISEERVLLPAAAPQKQTLWNNVSSDLIPFESFYRAFTASLKSFWNRRSTSSAREEPVLHWSESSRTQKMSHARDHPRLAGAGENLPLEILRCLSEWLAVIEERSTVSGNGLGGMYGVIQSFEDNLACLERVLTTPLPFGLAVHISTVWIYLFFLPFQLIDQFNWYTIPGVGIAAFIYLGFLAAGDEIEQPFGYDENDLDLDLFCRDIVHVDIDVLKKTPSHNVQLSSHHDHKHASIADTARSNVQKSAARAHHEEVNSSFGVLLS